MDSRKIGMTSGFNKVDFSFAAKMIPDFFCCRTIKQERLLKPMLASEQLCLI